MRLLSAMSVITALLAVLLVSESIAADAKETGLDAYEVGHYERAYEILSPLARAGDVDAQYVVGLMYAEGQGVEQNFYEAGKMYRRAGDQDHAGAQVNLGSLFENCYGNGPCDSAEAAQWYRRAADQGSALGQFNLALMYALGKGVTESEWRAKTLFRKAAEQGYTAAQYNLAVTYERGLGGPVDHVAAYAWYNLAAHRGYQAGHVGRENVARNLDAEDLSKAQQLGELLKNSYDSAEWK